MNPITIIYDQEPKAELIKEKQTALGLYVTAKETYENWKANPEKIKILDVRTLEEYLYIGHPAMAWLVPLALQSYEWDAEKKEFPMKINPEFLKIIKTLFDPSDIIMATCRSGGRSAMAANLLAQAGYKNVYNITDGFEGDLVNNPESLFNGQRMVNGWKNSGLPWTYSIDPKLIP
jgi:rhodanese-related sulfurtransferase